MKDTEKLAKGIEHECYGKKLGFLLRREDLKIFANS